MVRAEALPGCEMLSQHTHTIHNTCTLVNPQQPRNSGGPQEALRGHGNSRGTLRNTEKQRAEVVYVEVVKKSYKWQ